jgi:hypothetical protein
MLDVKKLNKKLNKFIQIYPVTLDGGSWEMSMGDYTLCHHASEGAAKWCRKQFIKKIKELWNDK